MKLSELVTTPKGRRATGKLTLDLLKITGKVAVAGTAGLVGALASAAASTSNSSTGSHEDDLPDHMRYGVSSSDPGGSPFSSDPDR